MVKSLVIELQSDAVNPDVPIAELLRKGLIVASKLNVSDISDWISAELNGYAGRSEALPGYRKLIGNLHGQDDFGSWLPVQIQHAESRGLLSTILITNSLAELAELEHSKSNTFMMAVADVVERELRKLFAGEAIVRFSNEINKYQIQGILDQTRNTILQWALALEEKGIIGEGLSFSNDEMNSARQTAVFVENLFHGVRDSQIQQGTVLSVQNYDKTIDSDLILSILGELKSRQSELDLEDEVLAELNKNVEAIQSQFKSTDPQNSIVAENLASIRDIVKGAAGSALFQGILYAIQSVL